MTQEEFIKALEERGFVWTELLVPAWTQSIGCAEVLVFVKRSKRGCVFADIEADTDDDSLCYMHEIPTAKALPLIDALIGVLSTTSSEVSE